MLTRRGGARQNPLLAAQPSQEFGFPSEMVPSISTSFWARRLTGILAFWSKGA